MITRWMVLMTVAAAVFAVDPLPASAQQVQVTGPLAGEPAVRHMRLYRKGRLMLTPVYSITLQDEFSRTMFVGAEVGYHFLDWLGVSLWGAFGVANLDTNLTDEVKNKGTTRDRNALSLPSAEFFPQQIGQMSWAAAFQLNFIPLRGKLALFQKVFIDADFFAFAGVAAVGVEERADLNPDNPPAGLPSGVCDTAPPAGATPADNECVRTQTLRSSRVAIAPTFGVGLNFYANDFIAVLLEWRGMPFKWNTSGWDVRGGDNETPDGVLDDQDRVFQFNHMATIGVTFFLPTEVKISD